MSVVEIEQFVDASCPYCFGALGTMRRMLDELAADPDAPAVRVTWRFLRLHDNLPPGGMPKSDYYARLGGGDDQRVAAARDAAVRFTRGVGVNVDPDESTHVYVPLAAHRLLAMLRDRQGEPGVPNIWAAAWAVWSANFTRGVDISDPAVVRADFESSGLLAPEDVWTTLADPDGYAQETLADREHALAVELDGVPRWRIAGTIVPMWRPWDEVESSVREALDGSVVA